MSTVDPKAATNPPQEAPQDTSPKPEPAKLPPAKLPKEIGGPKGPEPTRYGDWQFKGRVTDF